jgi:hypothetical protein
MTTPKALALATLLVTCASAQTAPPTLTATPEVSTAQIREALKDLKFEFKEYGDDQATQFVFNTGAYDITIFRFAKSLTIQVHFTDKLTWPQINGWNQRTQFGRAYLDETNQPFIETDLRFEGGVTKGALTAFIQRFPEIVRSFITYVTAAEKP